MATPQDDNPVEPSATTCWVNADGELMGPRLQSIDPTMPLLCRQCGYDIDNLTAASLCPECAHPIGQSLPEWRHGTPWQRRTETGSSTLFAALSTAGAVLSDPRGIWSEIRVLPPRDGRALAYRWAMWSVLVVLVSLLAPIIVSSFMPWNAGRPVWRALAYLLLAAGALVLILITLMWIEQRGIRVFGKLRGWRTTPAVAWTVVGHASVGWCIGAVFMTLPGAALTWTATQDPRRAELPQVLALLAVTAGPAISALIGLLTFETLVYIGFRSMRYANQHREPR